MHYQEFALPEALQPWVRAVWTLEGSAGPDDWFDHEALPDGCVEIVYRLRGRSRWGGLQPPLFAAGLATRPVSLRFTGDISCLGVRLWPWAWAALGGQNCASFADSWTETVPECWRAGTPGSPQAAIGLACRLFENRSPPAFAAAIIEAASVGKVCASAGVGHRMLQRWFAANTGLAPGRYLRLIRFQQSLARIQDDDQTLAAHAADLGYADQAHMARDFRELGGIAPVVARRRAAGPFI